MNPIFNNHPTNPQHSPQPNHNPMEILQKALNTGSSPDTILQTLASGNPQANALMQQIRNSGMSPRDFVMQYAKQNNLNLGPIIQMMSSRGIKL